MTIYITGAGSEGTLGALIDRLYALGVKQFVMWLDEDVGMACADYIAREKAAGRMADVALDVMIAGATGTDALRRRRDVIYPHVRMIVSERTGRAGYLSREDVLEVRVNSRAPTLR